MEDFDAVHVVSDLHLGGPRGHEIFTREAELAGWINAVVAKQEADIQRGTVPRVALVINGDVIDFIASYTKGTYLDPAGAVTQVEQLFGDDGAVPQTETSVVRRKQLRDALRHLVATRGCILVVVIGNHDVEMAFPSVQRTFAQCLKTTREQVVWATLGEGWRARVGGREVYCVHGNAADRFNHVDHDGVRRVIGAIERGEDKTTAGPLNVIVEKRFIRNFGTGLVVDVLNEVKVTHPFIDRLKPEGEQLFDVLLTMDIPNFRTRLADVAKLLPSVISGSRVGVMEGSPTDGPGRSPRTELPPVVLAQPEPIAGPGLRDLERLRRSGLSPADLAEGGDLERSDAVEAVARRIFGFDPIPSVRKAIRDIPAVKDYRDLTVADEPFSQIEPLLSLATTFFIAGHTHAPRMIPRRCGDGWYFNSGTWIDLVAFKAGDLATDEAFKKFYDTLGSGKPELLETDSENVGIVVSITVEGDKVFGRLLRVVDTKGTVVTMKSGGQILETSVSRRA